MTEVYLARWSREKRDEMVILDQDDDVVASFDVQPTTDHPTSEMLYRNGWHAYPGTEWVEEPPGCWSRAVHPQALE